MVEVYIQIFNEIWTLSLTPVSAYQFSGKLRDKKCSYCHQHIMVEVYIQTFDEIWILSPTPVLAIFRPYQVVRKFWVKMMEFIFANFFSLIHAR